MTAFGQQVWLANCRRLETGAIACGFGHFEPRTPKTLFLRDENGKVITQVYTPEEVIDKALPVDMGDIPDPIMMRIVE